MTQRHTPVAGIVGFSTVAVAYVLVTIWAVGSLSYNVSGAFLVLPVLVAATVPVLVRLARQDGEHRGLSLLLWAFGLKMASSLARYGMSYGLYNGGADGELYHDQGIIIAEALHAGLPWETYLPAPGSGTMEIITGYLYWAIGPTRVGGFFVYTWFSFLGLLLFTRAFRLAVPEGNARRYSLLVLFLPSLLFWPSSIGKEAWMTMVLGLAAYGAARLLTRARWGLPLLALALYGMIVVRPHMAVLVFGGLFVGYLVRPTRAGSVFGPLGKGVGVVVLVVLGSLLVVRAQTFFGVEAGGGSSVTEVLDETQAQTSIGGSSFEATPVRSPLDLPMAAVNVLLRPFPYEARNIQSLMASLESLVLLTLVWRGRRSLAGIFGTLRRQPYVAFAATYTLLFIVAFSSFANFGILTRQRVQVFPFALVLLALPEVARRAKAAPYVPVRAAAPAQDRPVDALVPR